MWAECWSSDYIGRGLHKPLGYHLKEQLWELVWFSKACVGKQRSCCVKRGCSAQRVGTCPPVRLSVGHRRCPTSVTATSCERKVTHWAGRRREHQRRCERAERKLCVCGQKKQQNPDWLRKLAKEQSSTSLSGIILRMLSLLFVVDGLLDSWQRLSILWPARCDADCRRMQQKSLSLLCLSYRQTILQVVFRVTITGFYSRFFFFTNITIFNKKKASKSNWSPQIWTRETRENAIFPSDFLHQHRHSTPTSFNNVILLCTFPCNCSVAPN